MTGGAGDGLWGDQAYLRDRQYATPVNLDARSRLHARYQTAPIAWHPWVAAQVEWPDGPLLDVGCGPGAIWTEGRPAAGGRVTLCDLSPGMVDAATRAVAAAGYDVEGLVADAQSIPVADRSRVLIVANHMLYHVPDPGRAVAEFARILTDDGVLMAATNGPDHMMETTRLEHAVFTTGGIDPAPDLFGFETGRAHLEAAFADVELRRYEYPLAVTDPDDVVAYLTSYPPGEDADDMQRARLRALVEREFRAADGIMTITRSSGVFLCRGPRR